MDDLISRQLVLDAITALDEGDNIDISTNEVRELLRELPSAEPIRCKDCKYYDIFPNGTNGMCKKSNDAWTSFYPWDFCSHGERRIGG